MNRTIEQRLKEIRERESKATKGPWCWDNRGDKCDDADFIAHARADIPFLLEQIELLRRLGAEPCPACPKCGSADIKMYRPSDLKNYDYVAFIQCEECSFDTPVWKLADFAQFFRTPAAAPVPEQLKQKVRELMDLYGLRAKEHRDMEWELELAQAIYELAAAPTVSSSPAGLKRRLGH